MTPLERALSKYNHSTLDINLSTGLLSKQKLSGTIPSSISSFSKLKTLNINNNNITGPIPDSISSLSSLRTLNLLNNNISGNLPNSISCLSNLTILNIHNNELTGKIPDIIYKLSKLTILFLSNNEFCDEIPVSIYKLKHLTQLNLYNNNLEGRIHESISRLSKLTELYLSENKLSDRIPESLYCLTNLTQLYLRNNNLSGTISDSISCLKNLTKLYLNNNNISGIITHTISNLSKLDTLQLQNNHFSSSIPYSISCLSNLTILKLDNNQLSGRIPGSITALTKLTVLTLNNNNLTGTIDNSISCLSKLTLLDLSYNKLSGNIPLTLSNISDKCVINISNNNFNSLSKSSILYMRLKYQQLKQNPLYRAWISHDFDKVVSYLKDNKLSEKEINLKNDLKEFTKTNNETRVILLGAPAAGKSTLISLIKDIIVNKKTSLRFSNNSIATDGIEVSNLNGYSFWDFGGQEMLYSTHQFFLSEESQYIIVVDLSKLISDDINIRKECIKSTAYWMDEVHLWTNNHKSAPIIFVGTHCDKLIGYFWSETRIKNAETLLFSMAKKKRLNAINHIFRISGEYSQKNNIYELFSQIKKNTNKYIIPNREINEKEFKKENISFEVLKKYLMEERKVRQYIWWDEYIVICNKYKIQITDEIAKVTRLLVNLGIILTYRQESSGAGSLIILNPEWLAKAFTSIVSISFLSSNLRRGFFTREILENNWKKNNIPSNTWNELERLFEMFQMIIRLPNGKYYVPSMVNSKKQAKPPIEIKERAKYINSILPNNKSLRRIYQFTKIPSGLVERIVIRILHYPGMDINTTTWYNDFCIESKYYVVHIKVLDVNRLQIDLHYTEDISNSCNLCFFSYFIFESPSALLKSFPIYSSIQKEEIYIENTYIGTEDALIHNFVLHSDNISNGISSIFLPDSVKRLDCSLGYFEKLLAKGGFGTIWLGRLSNNEDDEIVVFKELQHIENINNCREFLKEVIMMQALTSKYIIQLKGICNISDSLKKSKIKITNNTASIKNTDNHMLMVIEYASYGDLTNCKKILQEKSSILKYKIALDIAKGLQSLHLANGIKLIHRDVKSQNIFIFSLDEKSIYETDSIHAKLGDLGCVAIASPCYSEPIGNYQYTAPEALKGSLSVPYSSEIDIYSFGIVLWELLTSKIPFEELRNQDDIDPKTEIINGYRPSLDLIPTTISKSVVQLIKNCFHEDPKKRPSFNYIIALLSSILYQPNNNIKEKLNERRVNNIENALILREKLISRNITSDNFKNIKYSGKGCDGLVMICTLCLDEEMYTVALKMIINLHYSIKTRDHSKKCENEYNILPCILELHPNIIKMLGSFVFKPTKEMIENIDESIRDLCYTNDRTIKNAHFFILEKYETTLSSIMKDNPLADNQIIKYIKDLVNGLYYLYQSKIVHLDIKTDNLMISSTNDLVIVDFGVAGKLQDDGTVDITNTIGGNTSHLSPEVIDARNSGENLPCEYQYSWELGVILYEMITNGKLPFENYGMNSPVTLSPLNLSIITPKYREIISLLLCNKKKRLSIKQAKYYIDSKYMI